MRKKLKKNARAWEYTVKKEVKEIVNGIHVLFFNILISQLLFNEL